MANQAIESTLCFLTSSNPTTWATQLPWAECAHNALPGSASGVSLFQCVYGCLPSLFPYQESEVSVPSVQHHLWRCQRTWRQALSASLKASKQYQHHANLLSQLTFQGRRNGYPPRTYPSAPNPASSPLDSLIPSPLRRSWAQSPSGLSSHVPCASTPPSMFPESNS